jgi:fumarate reductase subunit D
VTLPIERRRDAAQRRDPLWIAAMVHRLSGLALACFLPVHFLTLGMALNGEARLDGFLRWTDQPAVKLGEAGLVFLLAIHFLGGLRVLALENFAWYPRQKQLAMAAAGLALLVALGFLVRAG